MNTDDPKALRELLQKQDLLEGLTDKQILHIQEISTVEQFAPNDIIFSEGDESSDVFLLLRGEVTVLKWDDVHLCQVPLDRIGEPKMFGEMSFVNDCPRSATIQAVKPTTVMKLSKNKIEDDLGILEKIIGNIATHVMENLKTANNALVTSLSENQSSLKERLNFGNFQLLTYLMLSLIMWACATYITPLPPSLPWLLATPVAALMIISKGLPWEHFGWNFKNWTSVISTSFLYILISIFFGFALIKMGEQFTLNFEWNLRSNVAPITAWPSLALYAFLQEFIARGVLQSALQKFLADKRGYKSVFINAAWLFAISLPTGALRAMNICFISIPLGIIFAQQRNILGVFVIHFLLLATGLLLT
jgi:CRP-like cAMP-binding protein